MEATTDLVSSGPLTPPDETECTEAFREAADLEASCCITAGGELPERAALSPPTGMCLFDRETALRIANQIVNEEVVRADFSLIMTQRRIAILRYAAQLAAEIIRD